MSALCQKRIFAVLPLCAYLQCCRSRSTKTGHLRKNEPHPVRVFASIGKFFDHSRVDRSLSVREAKKVGIGH